MKTSSTVRTVIDVARDRNLTLLAAGFAYYAFVSVIPLLVLVLVVGSLVGGDAFVNVVVGSLESFLSGGGQDVIEQVRDGVVVVIGIALAVGLMIVVGTILGTSGLVALPYSNVLGTLALIVGLAVAFLPLFYVLPPVDFTGILILLGAAVNYVLGPRTVRA